LAPGTYPINQPIVPNAGQTIQGGGRATLIGSRRLTDFVPTAHDRWVTDFAGGFGSRTGECLEGTACEFPNAVFSNGQPLRRVMSIVKVTEGTFYCRGHRIYVYGDPSQQQIEVAVAPVAVTSNARDTDLNVTVAGLTIEMFATPAQHGAIDTSAPGWTIEDDQVGLNHGAGVTTEGHATIENVDASDNGEEGIGGTGADTMVVDNVIDNNNWAGFDPEWEAGGAKWGAASDLTVSGNVVRDNQGPGLWSDVQSTDVTYEGNTVTGNTIAGIFFEISSDATISDNYVSDNGFGMNVWLWGSGILIAESSDVHVTGNTVATNANAIGLIQQRRGKGSDGQRLILHDISIDDNVVNLGTGSMGMVTDDGENSVFSDPTIGYSDNIYSNCSGAHFLWDNKFLTAGEWRALGHDVNGSFDCSVGT
jgi:parallel beta-helix repeat protein